MAGNNPGIRSIGASFVLDNSGKLTLVEDPTVNKTQSPNTNQLFKTTGPDGKVIFFLGSQTSKHGGTAVDSAYPAAVTSTNGASTSVATPSKNSQLTESQAKSLAKILSSVTSRVPAIKPTALLSQQHPSVPTITPAAVSGSVLGNDHDYSRKFLQNKTNWKLASQLVQSDQKETEPPKLPENNPEVDPVKDTGMSKHSGHRCKDATVPKHGIVIKQVKVPTSTEKVSLLCVPGCKDTQIKFDVASCGRSLLTKRVSDQCLEVTNSSSNNSSFAGNNKISGSVQSKVNVPNQNRIDPILSRFATSLNQISDPKGNLDGNSSYPNTQIQSKPLNDQIVIVNPKPVAAVKPEPATPLYPNPRYPVTLVNTSYVTMVPTRVPTYYPVILNQGLPRHPVVIPTHTSSNPCQEPTLVVKAGTKEQESVNEEITDVTCASECPDSDKELMFPEVCAEEVVEANDSVQNDQGNVEFGISEDLPIHRNDSVFPLTPIGDKIDKKMTQEDSSLTIEEKSSTLNSPNKPATRKRKRKKPKRLIPEGIDSSPRKCTPNKKLFLKPVVFDPCFVVLEPFHVDTTKELPKKSTSKKLRKAKKKTCTKQCRENFLRKLCKKKRLSCSLCFEQDVNKCDNKNSNQPGSEHVVRDVGVDDTDAVETDVNDSTMLLGLTASTNTSTLEHEYLKSDNENSVWDHSTFSLRTGSGSVDTTVHTNDVQININESLVCDNSTTIADTHVQESDMLTSGDRHTTCSRSPSPDTASNQLETYIPSQLGYTSLKSFSNNVQQVLPMQVSTLEEDEDISFKCNESIERFTRNTSSSPLESSPSYTNSMINEEQSPDPFQAVEDYLNQASECNLSKVSQNTNDDSDDDWGNTELEVDPDSDPDEGVQNVAPDTSACLPVAAPAISETAFGSEESEHTPQEAEMPARSPFLSEKVQRLKAILAEQTRQVNNLHRFRKRTK